MQNLPYALQSFKNIREFNCLYIDKTKYAHDLIVERQSFFLARPRRFGKSVFVSTLKEILLGEKNLFEGLWIAKSDYTWPVYGVIHLDFSSLKNTNATTLENSICQKLTRIAENYELSIVLDSSNPNEALSALTEELYKKFKRVAILIDEYDNPILSTLHSPNSEELLAVLKSFFTTVKSLSDPIHFLFLTGVSAFAKAGVFSGLNHPDDISSTPKYACVCGYTEEELSHYFTPYLEKMAEEKNISLIELKASFKNLYNGYKFTENAPTVYNPFSVTKALHRGELENFWFESGTPSFLIDLIKKEYAKNNSSIFHMEEFKIGKTEPKCFDVNAIPLPALLLQTGYLTIKDLVGATYTLRFPNLEVQSSFQKYILGILLNLDVSTTSLFSSELITALIDQNTDQILSLLNTLCSHIPSKIHISQEKFYHALLITMFQACGVKTLAEHATADGFIDLVLELPKLYYIVEVKLNKSTKKALEQIETKEYYKPFLQSKKTIRLLGINFHRTTQKQAGKKARFSVTLESRLY